jgi:translation elongation factor EF-4
VDALYAGEVGYLAASIKQVADARVGDTITLKRTPAAEALPGYTEAMPMVFCGLFPTGALGACLSGLLGCWGRQRVAGTRDVG